MKDKGFDQLLREAFAWHTAMERHFNGMQTAERLFRQAAYRFAVRVLAMDEEHHNQFVDQTRTESMDVETWLDHYFERLEQYGDDRRRLFANIKAGMTEKEYVRHGRLWGPRKRIEAARKQAAAADAKATPSVTAGMTLVEERDYWRALAESLKSSIRQLQHDNGVLLDEVDRLKRDMARINKIVLGRKKKLG